MKNTTAFLFLILLWAACKKGELPPDSFGSPVFGVQFSTSIGSDSVTAGVEEVYLFTNFVSNPDLVLCSGSFSKINCPDGDCSGSLTFEFKSEFTDIFEPDTVFHLGQYSFLQPDSSGGTTIFRTTFNATNTAGYNNFSWEIDTSFAGTGATLTVDFPNETPKLLELSAQKPSGLQSIVRREVSLINPGSFPAVEINVLPDSAGFRLKAETLGTAYDILNWSTGDTSALIIKDSLLSFYNVTASDFGVGTASATFTGLSANAVPARNAGFDYTVEQIFIPAPAGEVAIQWVDAQGNIWRSDRGVQSSDAVFNVTESESYEVNGQGQRTRKMRVSFSCRLFNGAGESFNFSGSGVITVAHP
jgi:hypothetical protein